jgi:hypothetical protein
LLHSTIYIYIHIEVDFLGATLWFYKEDDLIYSGGEDQSNGWFLKGDDLIYSGCVEDDTAFHRHRALWRGLEERFIYGEDD